MVVCAATMVVCGGTIIVCGATMQWHYAEAYLNIYIYI